MILHDDIPTEAIVEIEDRLRSMIPTLAGVNPARLRVCKVERVAGMPEKSAIRMEFEPELTEGEAERLRYRMEVLLGGLHEIDAEFL